MKFSILLPTRNRLEYLRQAVETVRRQSFADWEVVVSDNPTRLPVEAAFERWSRAPWRYLRHEQPLPMHDNFELACAEAAGDLVAVLIDKTVLHPSALQLTDQALAGQPEVDIVTWWNDGYNPLDEEHHPGKGRFIPGADPVEVTRYDPRVELARRFEHAEPRGRDPVHYVRGKIVLIP